jgi:glyoxylase-like metal-dependent hydrolase (beta-lactamase superfamily II)
MGDNTRCDIQALSMKIISRQLLLFALFAVVIRGGVQVALATSAGQAPGFYKGYLGTFEVTALSDGTASRHLDQILSNPALVREELNADQQSEPVVVSINAYLINTGSHLVLIDTGAGELFGAASGLLISNLKAAGYQPEQIDTILLTHIHGDHSGGLCVGGVRQFPNATVYVDKRDLEYFVTREDRTDDSETLQRQLKQSRATVGPYLKAGKIAFIHEDSHLIPGITTISQPGHTPGHTAYLVQNSGHALLVWGDIIHSSEVQFAHPEVTIAYDTAPSEAAEARLRQLQFTSSKGMIVASAHISFPGLGHVRKVGAVYRWLPIPYNSTPAELDPKP